MIRFEKKYYFFEAQRIVSDMLISKGKGGLACCVRDVWQIDFYLNCQTKFTLPRTF